MKRDSRVTPDHMADQAYQAHREIQVLSATWALLETMAPPDSRDLEGEMGKMVAPVAPVRLVRQDNGVPQDRRVSPVHLENQEIPVHLGLLVFLEPLVNLVYLGWKVLMVRLELVGRWASLELQDPAAQLVYRALTESKDHPETTDQRDSEGKLDREVHREWTAPLVRRAKSAYQAAPVLSDPPE